MKNVFYHVVTEKPMELNQEIIFDEFNHNKVYERVYKEKELVEKIYLKNDVELNSNIKKALREFALEEVRAIEFPNYPSRLSSLYVSNTFDEALFWYNLFINQGRETFQLVKIEVDGSVFTGDAWNCFEGTINKEENLNLARKYWNNEKNVYSKEPIIETLVNGKIKVIEILKENRELLIRK